MSYSVIKLPKVQNKKHPWKVVLTSLPGQVFRPAQDFWRDLHRSIKINPHFALKTTTSLFRLNQHRSQQSGLSTDGACLHRLNVNGESRNQAGPNLAMR
jgi:hypothetical protein